MAQSETSWGARLAKAQNFISTLQGFSNYKPLRSSESIAQLQQLTASITSANTDVVAALQLYTDAVEQRQKVFYKNANSIKNLLTPINSAVKATFGKASDESRQVKDLVQKIQGEKPVKIKEGDKETNISQSQRSYGSQAQNFSNIVTLLQGKGSAYDPANTNITVAALQTLVSSLPPLDHNVTTTYNSLKQNRDARVALYDDLSERITRAKEGIKSQYGNKSTEYQLVKNIKV